MDIMQEASSVLEQLVGDIRGKFAHSQHQQGVFDSLKAFTAAVDWKEPWLFAVLSLQTVLFVSVLVFRRNTSCLTSIFVLAMVLVYTSEHLNKILERHWQAFASQPYFDKNGIFISAVLSAPLVLDMLVILVCYLLNLSRMLVQMKRQELRRKAKLQGRSEQLPESKKTS